MASDRPQFKRIRRSTTSTGPVTTRNTTSNPSSSSSGRASESVATSRPNASSAPNQAKDIRRPASPISESDDDSIGDANNVVRNGRGPSRGLNLDKHVKKFGKMKIVFNPGEKKPIKYDSDFSHGIGVAVRTCNALNGVSRWKDVPDETKLILIETLKQWFIIEDLDTKRVEDIVDHMLQEYYRQWRYTLGTYCKKLKKEKRNPRAQCPRPEVPMENWLGVCDRVESQPFKDRSIKNQANRELLQFNHTSGRKSFLARFREMADLSEIELWRINHVDKDGLFVNDNAKEKYEKMIELKNAPVQEGEIPMSEAEILEVVLGHRSGYKKGMGHGVEVPRVTKRLRAQETTSSNEKISSLTMELEQQKEENKINKEQIANLTTENNTNKTQIESLMAQVERFNQFMGRFSEYNNRS